MLNAGLKSTNSVLANREVQMLQDGMKGQVDSIMYRAIGSVGELQQVQERDSDGFEVGEDQVLK